MVSSRMIAAVCGGFIVRGFYNVCNTLHLRKMDWSPSVSKSATGSPSGILVCYFCVKCDDGKVVFFASSMFLSRSHKISEKSGKSVKAGNSLEIMKFMV